MFVPCPPHDITLISSFLFDRELSSSTSFGRARQSFIYTDLFSHKWPGVHRVQRKRTSRGRRRDRCLLRRRLWLSRCITCPISSRLRRSLPHPFTGLCRIWSQDPTGRTTRCDVHGCGQPQSFRFNVPIYTFAIPVLPPVPAASIAGIVRAASASTPTPSTTTTSATAASATRATVPTVHLHGAFPGVRARAHGFELCFARVFVCRSCRA